MSILDIVHKYLREEEELDDDEIKTLRTHFINYAKKFNQKDIHHSTLITDLERESKNLSGLKNILTVMLHNGLDPI